MILLECRSTAAQEVRLPADGFSYERSAIESWLKGHDTSPRTNVKLAHKDLLPNRALGNLCLRYKTWREDRKKKKDTMIQF